MTITIAAARTIIAAALEHGHANGYRALCVAVLDAGGHLLAFEREDGMANRRFEIAFAKAHGALAIGSNSRTLEQLALERPHFMAGAIEAVGPVIPVPGGVIIRDGERAIGAVGISGDTSDHDEEAAIAGILAAGLTPSPH